MQLARQAHNRAKDISELFELCKSVSGIFTVLKEPNESTSYVSRILRLKLEDDLQCSLKTVRVGLTHGPLLEKIASGILVFGIGHASKQIRYFDRSDQTYRVSLKLGAATDTYCAFGKVVEEKSFDHVTKDDVESCLQRFIGHYQQAATPFYFEKPLCDDSTRKESLLKLPTELRKVVCHSVQCTEFIPPKISLDIHCGAVFSACHLVNELGKCLNSAAHVVSLERTRLGPFTLKDALPSYLWSWDSVRMAGDKHRPVVSPLLSLLKRNYRKHKQRKNKDEHLSYTWYPSDDDDEQRLVDTLYLSDDDDVS